MPDLTPLEKELLEACKAAHLALRATSKKDKDYTFELELLSDAIDKARYVAKYGRDETTPTPEPPTRGNWVGAHSSGYFGWKCTKCECWVYKDQPKVCYCDYAEPARAECRQEDSLNDVRAQ